MEIASRVGDREFLVLRGDTGSSDDGHPIEEVFDQRVELSILLLSEILIQHVKHGRLLAL